MFAIYQFGVFITAIILSMAWVGVALHAAVIYSKGFIYETKVEKPFWGMAAYSYDGADTVATLCAFIAIGFFGTVLWPLAWLVFIVGGLLQLARGTVRFKTVYAEHTHGKDGKVV